MQVDGQAASWYHESDVKTMAKVFKTMYGCTVELSPRDSEQNLRSPKFIKIALQEKGFTSLTHYNLVHKFIPMPQAMKIPDAKAVVDMDWKKLETIPAWDLGKVNSNKEVILEAQRDKKKVHFASLMDILHLKNAELEPKLQKYKGGVVLRETLYKTAL